MFTVDGEKVDAPVAEVARAALRTAGALAARRRGAETLRNGAGTGPTGTR